MRFQSADDNAKPELHEESSGKTFSFRHEPPCQTLSEGFAPAVRDAWLIESGDTRAWKSLPLFMITFSRANCLWEFFRYC